MAKREEMTMLKLEKRAQRDETTYVGKVIISPIVDEDYWRYRVRLTNEQAIVGFPKFGIIGIGFQIEDDWNTNLPFTESAEHILEHISHNKGDDTISDADCIAAIRLIQEAARYDIAN
jgi:hypothetical protein